LIYKNRALQEGRFTSFIMAGDIAKGRPEIAANYEIGGLNMLFT
jgi:hypothetical protein